jgi:hypothetical protein
VGAKLLDLPQDYLYQPTERTIAGGEAQVIVAVPGTIGEPTREASSNATRTTFDLRITVFYGGDQDFNRSRAVAQAYAAAVIGAIAQHPSLGDFAELTRWTGYRAGAEARSSTLWRTQSLITFSVVVSNALAPFGGPAAPSVSAPATPPIVQTENIQVTQE